MNPVQPLRLTATCVRGDSPLLSPKSSSGTSLINEPFSFVKEKPSRKRKQKASPKKLEPYASTNHFDAIGGCTWRSERTGFLLHLMNGFGLSSRMLLSDCSVGIPYLFLGGFLLSCPQLQFLLFQESFPLH